MTHIVLLHGALGSALDLIPLSIQLKNAQIEPRVFEFDGHGKQHLSSQFGIPEFVRMLRNYIQHHQLEDAAIFGYSMGGYIALKLAQEQTCLKGPIIILATKLSWTQAIAEKEAGYCSKEFLMEKSPAFYETLQKKHKAANDLLLATAQLLLDMPKVETLVPAKITNKSLLLVGDLDKLVSKEETIQFANSLPMGSFAILPNTKHPLETVDATVLAKQILDFVKA